MNAYGLYWGALAMAVTLAYTARYSKRNGDSARDVNALRFTSGLCFVVAALLAGVAHWPSG